MRQQALLEPLEGAHLALLKLVKYGAQRHSLLDHRRANVLHERQLDPPTLRNCLSFLECWVLSLGALLCSDFCANLLPSIFSYLLR